MRGIFGGGVNFIPVFIDVLLFALVPRRELRHPEHADRCAGTRKRNPR